MIGWRPGLRSESITYLTLSKLRLRSPVVGDLPFLKRKAFEQENEFRLIYESQTEKRSKLDIPISFSCIDGITLSPSINPSLYQHVKERRFRSLLVEGRILLTAPLVNSAQVLGQGGNWHCQRHAEILLPFAAFGTDRQMLFQLPLLLVGQVPRSRDGTEFQKLCVLGPRRAPRRGPACPFPLPYCVLVSHCTCPNPHSWQLRTWRSEPTDEKFDEFSGS